MKWIIALVGALIIVGGIWLLVSPRTANGPTPSATNESSLSVREQQPGAVVSVDEAVLGQSGYIVVHKDGGGKPGPVIGHTDILPAGTHTNVNVALTEATRAGDTVFVMLHNDDGDGTYAFPGPDVPTKTDTGDVVVVPVRVSGDAVMEDGTIDDAAEGPVADPVFHALVTYTDTGFDPKTVTIKKGETVRFVNQASGGMWVASAVHPTHKVYPEKSASDCLGSSFDTCRTLNAGEFWEFTFNEPGEWKYHNHVRANDTGTIVVQ